MSDSDNIYTPFRGKDGRYHYVYRTVNLVNGMEYIGKHTDDKFPNEYRGSGNYLKRAIEKYGVENFVTEPLEFFETSEEALECERSYVTEDYVNSKQTYNLKNGGSGGWDFVNTTLPSEVRKKNGRKGGLKSTSNPDNIKKMHSFGHTPEVNKKRLETYRRNHPTPESHYWFGRKLSEETKRKIGEANSKHQSGSGNSHYGTKWIYSIELRENRIIGKDEPTPEGWYDGRVLNWEFVDRKCVACGEPLNLTKRSGIKYCSSCKEKSKLETKRYYEELYEFYKKYGFKALKEKYNYQYTHNNMFNQFRKYLTNTK